MILVEVWKPRQELSSVEFKLSGQETNQRCGISFYFVVHKKLNKIKARFESDDEEDNEQIQCVKYIQQQQRVLKVGADNSNKCDDKTEQNIKQNKLGKTSIKKTIFCKRPVVKIFEENF